MKSRLIGDIAVSAIGLGGMPMSVEGRPDEARAIKTIHAALDAGVTLIDTADAYRLAGEPEAHNEMLIAKALKSYSGDTSHVLVATKGGHHRTIARPGPWEQNGHPEYLKRAAEASLMALDVEVIGLYQFHRPDPDVDFADSVGAIRDLLDEGKVRMAGISNADSEQIRVAQQILGGRLVSVQNEFSPAFRTNEPELELCTELGIAFLPYKPLGGIGEAGSLGSKFVAFQTVADARGVSPQVISLAWELAKGPNVIPIPGASRPESILDSVTAVDLHLSAEELAALDAA